MTIRTLALSLLFSALAVAAPPLALDAFKDSQLALPALSLEGVAAAAIGQPFAPAARPMRDQDFARKFSEAQKNGVTKDRMPILTPNPNVDYKLIVKAADPTLDPKILFPTEAR